MDKIKNRWLIAASTMGVHVSIGSVYAYSVFKKPLLEAVGWQPSQTAWSFSIAILVLGLSASFLGVKVEKMGPRLSGQIAAVFYGLGLILAGVAVQQAQIWMFYLGYGVIAGIGLGIGYICPVSTLVKWFPDRRGLATGLAVMGFGFGALFASKIFVLLIHSFGIPATFIGAGITYFVIMMASSRYLAPPPEGWAPAGMDSASQSKKKKVVREDPVQLTAKEALRTRRFYFLWSMLFINITCGIAVISTASPMSQQIAGLSPEAAATMVGLMGLFNGLGRIGWSALSDYLGRAGVFGIFCVLQFGIFFALPQISQPILFQAAVCVIISCYGGGFALMPAFIGDVFGVKQLSAILGNLLTAWAAAGVVGPMLSAFVYEKTQSYAISLYIFGGAFVVGLVLSVVMALESKRLRESTAKALLRPANVIG
ncbi:L-lactate MFS transporter [Cerasicoccus frondis]|uniref:L-lactate MFS transporter n=1 Tax=Cerasicoccus frondis TaxID=490090 RepID=UPI0028525036|nr:OFA family MFS transporter [Cerasicoccus frondis]